MPPDRKSRRLALAVQPPRDGLSTAGTNEPDRRPLVFELRVEFLAQREVGRGRELALAIHTASCPGSKRRIPESARLRRERTRTSGTCGARPDRSRLAAREQRAAASARWRSRRRRCARRSRASGRRTGRGSASDTGDVPSHQAPAKAPSNVSRPSEPGVSRSRNAAAGEATAARTSRRRQRDDRRRGECLAIFPDVHPTSDSPATHRAATRYRTHRRGSRWRRASRRSTAGSPGPTNPQMPLTRVRSTASRPDLRRSRVAWSGVSCPDAARPRPAAAD